MDATVLPEVLNKITQFYCVYSLIILLAPIGCLMYYTAISGTVTSFNYGAAANAIDPTTGLPGTRELVNENYGVCVAMAPGYCSIEWSQATTNSFVVSGSPSEMPGVTLNGDCTSDFVVIPNPVYPNGTSVGTDRFCGTEFPTVISNLFNCRLVVRLLDFLF